MPRGSSTYFVSHNWESADHPDNDKGTKLAWLKNIKGHLRIHTDREVWIWFDYFSVPQKNRDDQNKAIMSLPHYTQLCTRILPLVRDARRWEELYNTKPSERIPGWSEWSTNQPTTSALALAPAPAPAVRGDINTYYQRGWCQAETKILSRDVKIKDMDK